MSSTLSRELMVKKGRIYVRLHPQTYSPFSTVSRYKEEESAIIPG